MLVARNHTQLYVIGSDFLAEQLFDSVDQGHDRSGSLVNLRASLQLSRSGHKVNS